MPGSLYQEPTPVYYLQQKYRLQSSATEFSYGVVGLYFTVRCLEHCCDILQDISQFQ